MKTNKDKLIKFLNLKNKAIKEKTGILYVTKADMQEVESWTEKQYKEIIKWLSSAKDPTDEDNCAWCILFTCTTCNYGKRHGLCNDDDFNQDKYYKILTKLGNDSFVDALPLRTMMKQARII